MTNDHPVTPTKRAALAAAFILPVLSVLGACSGTVTVGSKSGYDADAVAKQVQKAQADATPDLDVTDATCPDDADVKKGASIECSVTIAGVVAPYSVTFTSVEGDNAKFDIAPAKAIVSVAKTIAVIQEQVDAQGLGKVDIDCGDAAVIVQDPKTDFTCTLTRDGQTQDITVQLEDLDGHITINS